MCRKQTTPTDPFTLAALAVLQERAAAPLSPDELLHEALLLRGFVALWQDHQVLLPQETPLADIDLLAKLVTVEAADGSGFLLHVDPSQALATAEQVISLRGERGWSSLPIMAADWRTYGLQRWGHKVEIWPGTGPSLDIGVALLVKTLPLIRAHTIQSCDGHGARPISIEFRTPWDLEWTRLVLRAMGRPTPHSAWRWRAPTHLEISPRSSRDAKGVLEDIQSVARAWLDEPLIEAVGKARDSVLAMFPSEPSMSDFRAASWEALRAALRLRPTLTPEV